MSTQTLEQTDLDPITGKGRVAHIVAPTSKSSAQALIAEALVYGIELEALCGHRWVPSRDPKQYPPCQACIEIWEGLFGSEKGLPDA